MRVLLAECEKMMMKLNYYCVNITNFEIVNSPYYILDNVGYCWWLNNLENRKLLNYHYKTSYIQWKILNIRFVDFLFIMVWFVCSMRRKGLSNLLRDDSLLCNLFNLPCVDRSLWEGWRRPLQPRGWSGTQTWPQIKQKLILILEISYSVTILHDCIQ